CDAVMLSMSTAPRPQTNPSTSSPENGSRLHPSGLTGTTSVWPMRRRLGASGSLPSMRVTRLVRPGWGSYRSTSSPAVPRYASRASTLRVSCPDSGCPSLTQALRIRIWSRWVVSAVVSAAVPVTLLRVPGSAGTGPGRPRARSGRGYGAVQEPSVLAPPLGALGEHHVLEVGEGLALGHDPPVLAGEDLVGQLGHRR